jgi:hypothetical protein
VELEVIADRHIVIDDRAGAQDAMLADVRRAALRMVGKADRHIRLDQPAPPMLAFGKRAFSIMSHHSVN